MNKFIENLKNLLSETVKRNFYTDLLFSGGLDTSILASLKSNIRGITVSLDSLAQDLPYAVSLAKLFNIKHIHRNVDTDEAIEAIGEVIKILRSFDPAIPNDLVVYFGLKEAKDLGIDSIATGDGSDELFAGYSFMEDIDGLESYIHKISKTMSFSSNEIGRFFGIRIIQPFIDETVVNFALRVPVDLKIRKYNGKTWGKWILRKSFEDVLPKEIVWQSKRPLEYGSGMNRLREIIASKIKDKEFKEKSQAYPIKFINKEHLYFYEIYRRVVGEVPIPKRGQKKCPGCGTGKDKKAFHCHICGWVDRAITA